MLITSLLFYMYLLKAVSDKTFWWRFALSLLQVQVVRTGLVASDHDLR